VETSAKPEATQPMASIKSLYLGFSVLLTNILLLLIFLNFALLASFRACSGLFHAFGRQSNPPGGGSADASRPVSGLDAS
jgi:hypothetical protein